MFSVRRVRKRTRLFSSPFLRPLNRLLEAVQYVHSGAIIRVAPGNGASRLNDQKETEIDLFELSKL